MRTCGLQSLHASLEETGSGLGRQQEDREFAGEVSQALVSPSRLSMCHHSLVTLDLPYR